MKGYKAFEKGLICRGKQYAENTVFEEDDAVICKKGMHFCKNPLAVLDYYPLVDNNGNLTEFAEVESLDTPKTDDNQKFVSKKLKIGTKLDFARLIKASVNFDFEKVGSSKVRNTARKNAKIGSSGDSAKIGSSGDSAKIGSSGDSAQIGSSGDSAKIGSSGYSAKIGSSGDSAQIGSSGDSAKIGSSGDSAKIGSSGDSAQIGSSGDSAQIGSSGDFAQIGSSGYSAKIGSSGYSAKIVSNGKYAVICCAGDDCIAKGKVGSWITLSEWAYSEKECVRIPICVKTEQIDGEKIKADTFYRLKNGEFVEVEII